MVTVCLAAPVPSKLQTAQKSFAGSPLLPTQPRLLPVRVRGSVKVSAKAAKSEDPGLILPNTSPYEKYDVHRDMLTHSIVGEELTLVFYLGFVFVMLMPVFFPPILIPVKMFFEYWLPRV